MEIRPSMDKRVEHEPRLDTRPHLASIGARRLAPSRLDNADARSRRSSSARGKNDAPPVRSLAGNHRKPALAPPLRALAVVPALLRRLGLWEWLLSRAAAPSTAGSRPGRFRIEGLQRR